MLGLGELIFVLVIVVQGVAAIAAAAQKKKKRAAARAAEIAAEEGRAPRDQSPSEERQRAMEERQARKALRQQKREAQLKQLQGLMESPAGKSMSEALSVFGGLGQVTTQDVDTSSGGSSQASISADAGPAARGAAPAPPTVPPVLRGSPMSPPVSARTVADDAAFAAFKTTGKKRKASPFAALQEDGPASTRRLAAGARAGRGYTLRGALRNRRALRQAFVLKTLLEPPVALRENSDTVG